MFLDDVDVSLQANIRASTPPPSPEKLRVSRDYMNVIFGMVPIVCGLSDVRAKELDYLRVFGSMDLYRW
jgi:hypothetical protein